MCARCLLNAVNGNVVDAIGGIHKTVLCSSLCMFVCSTITVVTVQSTFKKEAEVPQNPAESSGSPPDGQPMQPNAKRDWLGGQYDVHLFVPFFLLVHSAGSKLTVQCTRMSKSQGQTRELYSMRIRKRLDALTKSGCPE